MTAPENFVSRWARLKRSSASRETGPAETTIAQPETTAAADAAFDLASLPSIEAIDLNTDIRGFLQSRVPAELTRAALRQAWTSDPAIRDFIGIAENQWDFNDPEAMAGFGPLPEGYDVSGLLSQALGGRDRLGEGLPQIPASIQEPPRAVPGHQSPDPCLEARHSPDDGSRRASDDRTDETARAEDNCVAEANDRLSAQRRHGSALPRQDG
jgi:Protein of unknown function (DUF3306)